MDRCLRIACILLLTVVCALPAGVHAAPDHGRLPSPANSKPLPALILNVQPPHINVGRDVKLTIRVTDKSGQKIAGALVSVLNTGSPVLGRAPHGVMTVLVHASVLGMAQVQASHMGYAPVTMPIPIVPGPPASVAAIKLGMTVLAPHTKPLQGQVGTDLFEQYHALTGARQYASLSLRDGTLMDLNTNTDVLIKDPLHSTVSKGELFLEVVHGAASHQVQVGTAVAATKGTRLDVRINPKTKAAVIAVVEGQVLVSSSKVGRAILVGANQQTTVAVGRAPTPPTPVDLTKLLAWVTNLPNTNTTTVPPVLNLPAPIVTAVPLPPVTGSPAITLTGTLTTSTTLSAAAGPYLVQGTLTVPANLTLTIAPGTVFKMGPGAAISARGVLLARGTQTAPIIFTSASTTPAPGNWGSLQLDSAGASQSALDHVQLFYGGANASGFLAITGGANISVTNSVFAQSIVPGITIDGNSTPTVTNCVFAGDTGPGIVAPANAVSQLTNLGYGANQAGMQIQGTDITRSVSWQRPDVPYVIHDTVNVDAGVTLTLAPGTVFKMGPGAAFFARGVLLARGTQTAPIIFTSAATTPAPGSWGGIQIDSAGASQSVLDHVQLFYGGANASGFLAITGGANISVTNSVFAQSIVPGITIDGNSTPTVTNCVFAGDTGPGIVAPANAVSQLTNLGYGANQAGMQIQGTDITRSVSWQRPDVPYVIHDTVNVDAGVTLTLAPGTVFKMGPGAAFFARGVLLARGTQTAPIIFTSASTTPAPGNWGSLQLDSAGASQSALDHVQLFYGGANASGFLAITGGANISVTNSVFAQSIVPGITIDGNSTPTVTNCVFAGDTGPGIIAPANAVSQLTNLGYGANQAGMQIQGTDITRSVSWQRPDVPYVIHDTVNVDAGVTLTLAPGTVFKMGPGAAFFARGVLLARGTQTAPIIFTSAATTPAPGSWGGIQIDSAGASQSALDHVQLFYGGANASGFLAITGGANISVTNSVFENSAVAGIVVQGSQPTIVGCTFRADNGPAISLPAADPKHIHDNVFLAGQQGVKVG